MLLVDPPYDKDAVEDLYSHISTVAGRILKEEALIMYVRCHLDKAY